MWLEDRQTSCCCRMDWGVGSPIATQRLAASGASTAVMSWPPDSAWRNGQTAGSALGAAGTGARPAVSTVIIGARTSEQLADNLAAAELTLTDDETTRLEEVSRPTLLYPYWHQVASAGKRLGPADLSLLERHRDAP